VTINNKAIMLIAELHAPKILQNATVWHLKFRKFSGDDIADPPLWWQ